MADYNYHEDTAIDPDELLEEWISLSSLFHDYADALTEATKVTKIAHEKLKTIRSELVLKAKTDEGLGNPKATIGEIEAYYRTSPEYQKAKNDLIDAEYNQDMIQNAVSAFYRKEKAIEGAVNLHKMEWWLGPKEPVSLPPGKRLSQRFKKETASAEKRQIMNSNRRRRK